jgi:hypothetical protein
MWSCVLAMTSAFTPAAAPFESESTTRLSSGLQD